MAFDLSRITTGHVGEPFERLFLTRSLVDTNNVTRSTFIETTQAESDRLKAAVEALGLPGGRRRFAVGHEAFAVALDLAMDRGSMGPALASARDWMRRSRAKRAEVWIHYVEMHPWTPDGEVGEGAPFLHFRCGWMGWPDVIEKREATIELIYRYGTCPGCEGAPSRAVALFPYAYVYGHHRDYWRRKRQEVPHTFRLPRMDEATAPRLVISPHPDNTRTDP